MKKIIFLIICAFFYIEKSEAQNSLNTETNDIFYYYSLFIPGDAKVSRWPLWMTGISKNDMRKELLSIKSFDEAIHTFYKKVTYCTDIYFGYTGLMRETTSEYKDHTLDALALQDAITEYSIRINFNLGDGTSCFLEYCQMKATFVHKTVNDYHNSLDGSELLSPDEDCMVLKNIDYFIVSYQSFKDYYLKRFFDKKENE